MQFMTVKSIAADVLLGRWIGHLPLIGHLRPVGREIMTAKSIVNFGSADLFREHQNYVLDRHGADALARVNRALGETQIFQR